MVGSLGVVRAFVFLSWTSDAEAKLIILLSIASQMLHTLIRRWSVHGSSLVLVFPVIFTPILILLP